jgi:tetratricopeptide (TPR) repeat protein
MVIRRYYAAVLLVHTLLALMLFAPVSEAKAAAKREAEINPLNLQACGPVRSVNTADGNIDYRKRFSSPVVKKGVSDLDYYHTRLAQDDMRKQQLSYNVKANLDFSLRYSPNHHAALQILSAYDLGGGKEHEFASTDCYFYWASLFAPTDEQVAVIGATYLWKKGRLVTAEEWFQRALRLNAESIEARYNLGLLYVTLGRLDEANTQAQIAYAGGYPLPGLRRKLEQAGKWKPGPTSEVGRK